MPADNENTIDSPKTIHETILQSCQKHLDKTALIGNGGDGPVYLYKELKDYIEKASDALRQRNIKYQERVGILGTSCPEWAVAYLAILSAGCTVVPLDPALKETELLRFFRISSIKLLFCSQKLYKTADDIITLNDLDIKLVYLDGEGQQNIAAFSGSDNFVSTEVKPDDTAVIIYTSGTTGDPKGVILTHGNILSNLISVSQALSVEPNDVFLSVLPMHHTFEATAGFLHPLHLGLKIVYVRALNTRDILNDIKSNQITNIVAVPLLYEKMYNAINRRIKELPTLKKTSFKTLYSMSKMGWKLGTKPGKALFRGFREKTGLSSIRRMVSGGAPIPSAIVEWFNLVGFTFLEGYGLTECSPVVSVNRPEDTRFGSVGPPLPGVEVAIDKPSPEGIGEIKVKGPNNTPGYLANPEATDELIIDGWLHTGDLGKIENGHLYVTGRAKNLIVSGGGKNIYPEEIESELNLSEYVLESIVLGRKKEKKTGEEIWALIVPDLESIQISERGGDKEPSPDRIREIIAGEVQAVNNRLADYKRIEKFEIRLEEFEKTTSKKIKRRLYQ